MITAQTLQVILIMLEFDDPRIHNYMKYTTGTTAENEDDLKTRIIIHDNITKKNNHIKSYNRRR